MSAKPKPHPSDALLPPNEFLAPPESAPPPLLKVVSENPAPIPLELPNFEPARQPAATDPLQAIKAMSEEEKIALFS